MSNAIFNKAGNPTRVISLPASSVFAILSTAMDAGADVTEPCGCYILSRIGGVRNDGLVETGDEAMEAIKTALASKKRVLKFGAATPEHVRLSVGDDGSHILPEQILGYEEVDEARLRVFWQATEGKPATTFDVSNTPANRQAIDKITQGA